MLKVTELLESAAAIQAKKMGLEYYGFGRYGLKGTATHKSVGGVLMPISKEEQKKVEDLKSKLKDADEKEDSYTSWDIERQLSNMFKTRDFRIPVENLPMLEAKIKKLNNKASKMGQSPLVLTKHGVPQMEVFKKGNPKAEEPADRYDQYKEYQYITLEGHSPKLNGWEFIGKLEPYDGSVLTKSIPGKQIPLKYSAVKNIECEHCKKNVRRNETFILQKGDDHIQVGRSCLKDFLGHADPGDLANWAETIHDLESMVKDYEKEGSSRGTEHYMPTHEVLSLSFAAMNRDGGFKPSSFDNATKTAVWDHYFRKPDKYRRGEDIRLTPTTEDNEKATAAIQWLKDTHGHNTDEFWMNLNKMTAGERVKPNHFGYVAALAGQYEKHLGIVYAKKKQTEGIVDLPLGQVGDRVKFEAEVVNSFSYTGRSFSYYDSGVRTVYTMRTTDGKLVKWFASGKGDFNKGDVVIGKGTIKSVETENYDKSPYKGHTMSTISRGSFEVKNNNPGEILELNAIVELTVFGRGDATKKVIGVIDTFNKKSGEGTLWTPDGMYKIFRTTSVFKILGTTKNKSDADQYFPNHNL